MGRLRCLTCKQSILSYHSKWKEKRCWIDPTTVSIELQNVMDRYGMDQKAI